MREDSDFRVVKRTTTTAGAGSTIDSPVDPVLTPLAAVTQREGLDPLSHRLIDIQVWLKDELSQLASELTPSTTSDDLAERASNWILARPGKRIRPLCVLLAARLGGRLMDDTVRDLAIACELVHAATLLHDDVIDMGTERRGAPTARLVFGNSASVLGGDHLLIHALQRVRQTGFPTLLTSLLDVISQMITAEAIQLEARGRFEPNRETYMKVVKGKTAALFRWGLEAGGTAGGLHKDEVIALGRVGVSLGVAFQMVDDILDLSGDPAVTGKDAMVDLAEGKLTWPLILASERDPKLGQLLQVVAGDTEALSDPEQCAMLRTQILQTGALDATREEAKSHARKAHGLLDMLPHGNARTALEAVVQTAIARCR
jgi:octaprenyl-diphosphate synthase